ncbi:MAG: hypothetical protein CMJ76_15160 [Planctomycetaceae bacterium]|nr:hypothetical protein [Planctomycetaceae bacterium]|tara:strand:+ start:419 stop:637 length:219 start_codon:yes stop_codon:yes gene_type:complete
MQLWKLLRWQTIRLSDWKFNFALVGQLQAFHNISLIVNLTDARVNVTLFLTPLNSAARTIIWYEFSKSPVAH